MKHVFTALGVAVSFALPAQAVTIAAYEIPTNASFIVASEEADGVDANVLSRAGGLVSTGVGTFRSKSWTLYGDANAARASYNSITWGFNSTTAYDLTTLDIRYDGSNKGPKSIVIDAIVNGGAPVYDIYSDHNIDTAGETNLGIDLSMFTNVTSIQFILSGWGATKEKGTFELRNMADGPALRINGASGPVALSGNLNERAVNRNGEFGDNLLPAVPLPAGLPLLLAGLGGLAVLRRRK